MAKCFKLTLCIFLLVGALALVLSFRKPAPINESRFVGPDELFAIVDANIRSDPESELIVAIDHARLAAEAGSPMPPARVLIWSNSALEASILQHNPVAAVDLPLRVLAYEDQATGESAVIFNSYDFIAQRYRLPADETLRAAYDAALANALKGIPAAAIKAFATDAMPDDALITLDSPYDFATTEQRVREAIQAQSDTVGFGQVDFAERSKAHGIDLQPLRLILFGGPGPGGKAMASAPTLGLDAFCQKMLIWQDESGTTHVTFNNLLALAKRQKVSSGLPLRVIHHRLQKTFSAAVE